MRKLILRETDFWGVIRCGTSANDFSSVWIASGLITHPEQTIRLRLPITDRLQCRSARRAKSSNIPHRWLTEEPAVFAVELAGAFIPDLKSRTCGVQPL